MNGIMFPVELFLRYVWFLCEMGTWQMVLPLPPLLLIPVHSV